MLEATLDRASRTKRATASADGVARHARRGHRDVAAEVGVARDQDLAHAALARAVRPPGSGSTAARSGAGARDAAAASSWVGDSSVGARGSVGSMVPMVAAAASPIVAERRSWPALAAPRPRGLARPRPAAVVPPGGALNNRRARWLASGRVRPHPATFPGGTMSERVTFTSKNDRHRRGRAGAARRRGPGARGGGGPGVVGPSTPGSRPRSIASPLRASPRWPWTSTAAPSPGTPPRPTAMMTALDGQRAMADLEGAVAHLRAHPRGNARSRSPASCMARRLHLRRRLLRARPGLRGAVRRRRPAPPRLACQVDTPIQARFASRDGWAKPDAAREIARVRRAAARRWRALHVYDAEHAFMNERRPEVHAPEAAALAGAAPSRSFASTRRARAPGR
ncbi:MAG: dienelactone hydrolase family protein [Kofleriaceae bacterium]|nr:dienelactone hydrolase family protein [Kofleriaceae bacterium]